MSPPFITFPQLNFMIKKRGVTYQKTKTVVQGLTDFHNDEITNNPNENGAWSMRTMAIAYFSSGTGTFLIGHSNFSGNTFLASKIWRTTNNGQTWARMDELNFRYIQSVNNFGPAGTTAIATGGGGGNQSDIYRSVSSNIGSSWALEYNGSHATIYDNSTGIFGSKMVVGGGYQNGSGGILRWTIDTGANWNAQNPTTSGFTRVVSPTYAGINGGNEQWLALAHTGASYYSIIQSNQTLDATTNATWGNSWTISPNQPFAGVQQRFEWIGGNTVLSFSYSNPIQIRVTSDYYTNVTVGQTLPAGLNNVRKLINFGSGQLWILCSGPVEGSGVIYESTDFGATWNVNNPIQAFPDMATPYNMVLNTVTGSVYVIGNYISTHPTNPKRALLYEIS